MPTANEEFLDAQLRHAIGVQRFTAGEVQTILAMLDRSNAEIAARLSLRLKPDDFTSQRFIKLMREIKIARKATMLAAKGASQAGLLDFAKAEQQFTKAMLETTVPIQFEYAVASAQTLKAIVTTQPFSG